MRLPRRTVAAAGIAAALLLAALASGRFPQEPLRRRAEDRLRAAVGPASRIGRLRVTPGGLSAELEGVVLDAPGYRLEADRATVTLSRETLSGGGLVVDQLHVQGARLLLRTPPEPPAASAPPTGPLVVRDLRIAGATVRYEDPAVGAVQMSRVDLRGSIGEGVLQASAEGGVWERPEPVTLGPVHARVRISPHLDLHLESVDAGLQRSRLHVEGPLGRVGALRPDLAFSLRADLEELQALAPIGPASGIVAAEGRLRGSADAPEVEATVRGEALRAAGWPLDRLDGRVTHRGTGTAAEADLRVFGGSGRLDARLRGRTADGRLRLAQVDLRRLQAHLGPARSAVSGRGGASVRFEGEIGRRLRIEAEVEADGRDAAGVPFRGHLHAEGPVTGATPSLDFAWTATVETVAAGAPAQVRATGTARGPLPPAVAARVGGTLSVTTPRGPEPLVVEGDVRSHGDRTQADLRVSGLGGRADVSADVQGRRVRALRIQGHAFDLARLAEGAEGRFGFEIDGKGTTSALAGTAGVDVDAAAWRGTRVSPISAAGTFDLPLGDPGAARVRAEVSPFEVRKDAHAARVTQPFGIALDTRRVSVRDLHVAGPGLAAQASGSVGLDERGPIDLRATLQGDAAEWPVPAGWTVRGRAEADVTVQGTRTAPRAHGFVSLEDAWAESPTVPPVHVASARVELAGDAVVLPGLRADVADGWIELGGRVPVAAIWPAARREKAEVRPDEEAALTGAWSGVDAGALLRRLRPDAAATVAATVSGTFEVRGGLAALEEPRATVRLPATTARVQELDVELAPAEVRLERGRVRTEGLELRAAGGRLIVSGGVDLRARTVDAGAQGTLDLRALSPFLEETALGGTSQVDLRVQGPLDAPRPEGTLAVRDGIVRMRALPQALTGLAADAVFADGLLRLRSATATFGGGTLSAAGAARLGAGGISEADFTLTGRELALRYPEGMRSRLEADLKLTGRTGALRLSGSVRALRGIYDLDTALEESFTTPVAAAEPSPLLRSIALDVRVTTESPVLVRNNLVQMQATGRLAVRGDMDAPAPIGTLDIQRGGKVLLQGREFLVESGRLVYAGTWDPELALEAAARLADHDRATGGKRADVTVTVGLAGRLATPSLTLRSDPPYSNVEIVNLVATGDSQNPDARLAVGGPAAALLAGRITRGLRGLGLDEVSIQPELVAREGDVETGARFTFGKRLSSRVNLVYSLSLQDPEARFVQVDVAPGRDVALTTRRTDEGSFTWGAGQRFRFGGAPARTETVEQRVRVSGVRVDADQAVAAEELREALGTRAGDRRTVWDLQDDADRLRARLVDRGHLEAEVGARLEDTVAVFTVRAGARYRWTVEGMSDPPGLDGVIRSSLFEEEALERGRQRLLAALRERGHLEAAVEARAEPEEDGGRRLVFAAAPGPAVEAEVVFPGAAALAPGRLLRAAGGPGRLLAEPAAAVADVLAAYHAAHHLAATVGAPRVTRSDGGVRVTVPVTEGPHARVSAVRVEGATRPADELARVAGVMPGEEYRDDQALAAAERLRLHYFGLGHAAVRVTPRVEVRGSDVTLVLAVAEGERVTVGDVQIVGLHRTSPGRVRAQVRLRPGDPLDPRKVAELERRLLDLGLFTRAAAVVSETNPATVTVTVEEGERLRSGYLFSYNDDKGSRGELDGELRGLLGAGLSLGGRLSVGPDVRDARGQVTVPPLLPTGRVTLSVFRLAEDLPLFPDQPDGETFERVQVGGQIQATRPLGNRWNLLYGYRIKRSTVTSTFLTSSRRVAGLDVSLLRDTRDDPLDARRGRFLTVSLEVAPKRLGSDFDFVKGFAQAFVSRPLRGGWTWAHGYRLGAAHAFGGEPLVADEGFEAGGANSIRGFGPGEVGPEGYRFGRQATLVVNQELRYHHPSGLGGVVFYDAGNTWATVEDASLRLRHVLGAGLRWRSPVGLLRADVGLPLDRREGEPAYKLFFSFGQAF